MPKCNCKYLLKYACDTDTESLISAYDIIQSDCNLKCCNDHIVVLAHTADGLPYFKHQNKDDLNNCPVSSWHINWQLCFPNIEKEFKKIFDKQIKSRRADVVLDNDYNLEVQNSPISDKEVHARCDDYALHGRKIWWILNGNGMINVKILKHANRVYLIFLRRWYFESFKDKYDKVFIEIANKIYTVYPKDVRNNMIDVEEPIDKQTFIDYLKTDNAVIHAVNKPPQCKMYIKQQGAGNGKTYNIIQMLGDDTFENYKYFVMVTKQHSAKYQIYNEFKKQVDNKSISNILLEEEPVEKNRKHIIKYKNLKTGADCSIIICTIDSLMSKLASGALTDKSINAFEANIAAIINGFIESNDISKLIYHNAFLKLNKEFCLICDETQDLPDIYGEALVQIMRDRYIDLYVVGDRLQSLAYTDNAFTYLSDNEFSYIDKVLYRPTNVMRRTNETQIINFINHIVPFDKYNLPAVIPHRELAAGADHPSLVIFRGEIIRNYQDKDRINKEIETFMEKYRYEVNTYNRKPNHFLIETVFTKNNALVNAIELAIETFWQEREEDNGKIFRKFAIFHKSQEGTSIDLKESDDATRIVSIHSAKGDGRPVVFVIGLEEKAVRRFSRESDNLIFHSLVHVAFTRAKEKLYIRYVENSDIISNAIKAYAIQNHINVLPCEPILDNISHKISFNTIIDDFKNKDDFDLLKEMIINGRSLMSDDNNKESKKVIDMSHHVLRKASMVTYFYIKILQKQRKLTNIKKQLFPLFDQIKYAKIRKVTDWKEYNKYLCKNKSHHHNNHNKGEKPDPKNIPIIKLSDSDVNERYFDILCEFVTNLKEDKIPKILQNQVTYLCPFEQLILYYMLEVCQEGICSNVTIKEIYNILDIYSNAFDHNHTGHNYCLCKSKFRPNEDANALSPDVRDLNNYLLNFFQSIQKLDEDYDCFLDAHMSISFLINQPIQYHSRVNKEYIIRKKFHAIAYDDKNVYCIYIVPFISGLNNNELLIQSIFDNWIIDNVSDEIENFAHKNVKICIFSTNEDPIIFDWENKIKTHYIELTEMVKSKIFIKLQNDCKIMHDYFCYHAVKNAENPEMSLNYIVNSLKNINDKRLKESKHAGLIPDAVIDFFKDARKDVIRCRSLEKQKELIDKFKNRDNFMEELHVNLYYSLKIYFNRMHTTI